MGIAEMNPVLLLGQLGLSWDFQRERLFPIGTQGYAEYQIDSAAIVTACLAALEP
jgi:hypothetical protein